MVLTTWLLMGGYGGFVWTAYAICLLILALNVYLPLRQHKRLLADLNHLDKDQDS